MSTTFNRGFKTKLDPNRAQIEYFAKACGTARFSYNWGLDEWNKQYKDHQDDPNLPVPNEAALRRQLNSIKREQYPWMLEVSKCAAQYAIKDLGKAFNNFFKNPKHFGYPKYKKKFVNDSFTLSSDHFKVEGSRIRIPLLGWVRMHEPLRFENAKLLFATISRQADGWYVSFQLELSDLKHLKPAKNQGAVGVDLGINKMATLSDSKVFEAPKPLGRYLKKLKRVQKKFSRAKSGSNNRKKLAKAVARLHQKIANIRKDALHKVTHYISSNYNKVVIENLHVTGMLKNHKLARSIADIGFWEFRRQLEYKVVQRGGELVVADRWYPSSKLCRFCLKKNDGLTLSDRSWICPHCGQQIQDRDLNAAINLCRYPTQAGDRKVQSESSADLAPSVKADLPGALTDDLTCSAGQITDEVRALPKGHPEVTVSEDWGRESLNYRSELPIDRFE